MISSANFLSGGVYQQINDVSEYLNLRTENEALALENARLKSILFNTKDTSFLKEMDSIKGIPADDILVSKVIHNSYNVHENFLTLNSDLMMELNKIWV
jgi:rod shape-determining protein MreC